MSKFQKLKELNKDIELLEYFGKFKSASILHDKFIKEAQIKPVSYATEDRGFTYEKYFNDKLRKLQNAQNKDLVISEIRSDGFLKEEDKQQIINAISNSEKSAPVGQLSDQVQQEQKDHQAYLSSVKTPLIPVPEKLQQQSPVQTLSDTANQNAAMDNFYSAANAYKAPEDYFTNSLLRAKRQLSLGNLNDAALIRDEVDISNMDSQQKIAWNQQYNILVQNFSYAKQSGQYDVQQKAEDNIYFAAKQLGATSKDQVTPQFVKDNEVNIMNTLKQYNMYDNATMQLLRQISLSEYYINKA